MSRTISVSPSTPGRAVPCNRFAPVKLATNASAGAARSSAELPSWRIRPSTITPTRPASAAASSKSCVTSSVGRPQLGEQLGQLAAHDPAGVRVESRERLVEQEHVRIAGERPRQSHPLPLAAGEVARARVRELGDPEPLQKLVHSVAPTEADVAPHIEVRKERVLLEYVALRSGARAADRRRSSYPARSDGRARCARDRASAALRSHVARSIFPAPDGPTRASVVAAELELELEPNGRRAWSRVSSSVSTWGGA